MADYHIGEKSSDGRNCTIYVHLPVTASENVAGQALGGGVTITYRNAQAGRLAKDNPEGYVSYAPGITSAERTQITNGEIIEKIHEFRFSSLELTNMQRRDEIENGNDNESGVKQWKLDIANSSSELYKELLEPLAWWGYYKNTT